MYKFLVKKSFFDVWDNLLPCFVYNIVFMAVVALYVFIAKSLLESQIITFILVSLLFILIFSVLLFGIAGACVSWSSYLSSDWFSGFVCGLKKGMKTFPLFYLLTVLVFLICSILIPFYFSLRNYMGVILAVVLFWISFFTVLTLLFYPFIAVRTGEKTMKVLRMAMTCVSDNKGFVFLTGTYLICLFFLSALSFFIIPGVMGLSMLLCDASMLIELRNNYANEHLIRRKNIDVRDMLLEEEKKLGKRTFRGMIFPWKNEK